MPTLRCAQIYIDAQHHLTFDLRQGVLTPLPGTAFPQDLLCFLSFLLFKAPSSPARIATPRQQALDLVAKDSLPGRASCEQLAPPQTRTSPIKAYGSSG
jgi:hypothetical protein